MNIPLARFAAPLAVVAALLCPGRAAAQAVYTWNGGAGNGSWASPGNWNSAPQSGATTTIVLAGTAQTVTNQDLLNPFVLHQLVIDTTATNGFSVLGNRVQFAGTAPQILQNNGGAVSLSVPLDLAADTTFGGTGAGLVGVSGSVTGSGGLTKTGAYPLILSGTNSFGPTSGSNPTLTLNGGALQLGSSTALPINRVVTLTPATGGSATLDLNGFLASVSTLNLGSSTAAGAATVAGGTLSAGTINVNLANGAAPTAAPTITSTLDVSGTTNIAVANNPSTAYDLILTGPFTGSGTLTKSGNFSSTLLIASRNNTFSGTVSIQGGLIRLGAVNALGRTVLIDTGGSSTNTLVTAITSTQGFTAGGFSQTFGSVTGSGTLQIGDAANASAVLIGFGASDYAFAGKFSAANTGSHLAKVGNQTMTLTGNTTAFNASLSVRGGTVAVQGSGTLTGSSMGAVTILSGATLLLDNAAANVGNRLADGAPINLSGGLLRLTGNSGTATAETVGALTVGGGQSTVLLSPDAAQGTRLTFASGTGGAGTVLFRGPSLGQTPAAGVATVIFTSSPALVGGGGSGAQTSILPWGLGSSAGSASPDTFVTVGANGVRPLNTGTEFATYGAAGTTNNVLESSGFTVAAAEIRNSLVTTGGGAQTLTLNGDLTLTSGAFMNTGSGTLVSGPGTLLFGPSGGGPAYLTAQGGLTLAAPGLATGLVKSGAGTLTVQRQVSVSGGIVTVAAGTLMIQNNGATTAGAFTAAGGVTYQVTTAATLDISGVTAGGGFALGTNSKLQGSGSVTGSVAVANGGTLEPTTLPGPGFLTVGSMTWQPGGTYRWQVSSAQGANDGITQSKVNGSGTLDLTGLSSGSPFNIQLAPLAVNNTSGAVYDFDNTKDYSWPIATFAGITGFSSDKFTVDSAAFAAGNPLGGGTFAITEAGSSLMLTFTPVPEAGWGLLLAAGGLIVGRAVSRVLRNATSIGVYSPSFVFRPAPPGAGPPPPNYAGFSNRNRTRLKASAPTSSNCFNFHRPPHDSAPDPDPQSSSTNQTPLRPFSDASDSIGIRHSPSASSSDAGPPHPVSDPNTPSSSDRAGASPAARAARSHAIPTLAGTPRCRTPCLFPASSASSHASTSHRPASTTRVERSAVSFVFVTAIAAIRPLRFSPNT